MKYSALFHLSVPIISCPRFHRWHHTEAEEGRDKNFAGLPVRSYIISVPTKRSGGASIAKRRLQR
jgi:hypothetical protein